MFSHIVIFWTKPDLVDAPEQLIAGAEKYLRNIPGIVFFQAGRAVGSPRPVVEQSYQVALNVVFKDQQAQDEYQIHPQHLEFIQKLSSVWSKVVIYDFA